MPKKPPTLRDVAKKAGVSTATVSRLLNRKPDVVPVRESTRVRVFEAARDLGYRPNRLARGLATSKTNIIGLGLPLLFQPIDVTIARYDEHYRFAVSGGFSVMGAFLEAVLSVTNQEGYDIHIYSEEASPAVGRLLAPTPCPNLLDGFICTLPLRGRDIFAHLRKIGVPTVGIMLYRPESGIDCAYIDPGPPVHQVTQAWVKAGHKRIAVLLPAWHEEPAVLRFRSAYEQAQKETGISPDERLIIPGAMVNDENPRDVAKRLLDLRPMPTALLSSRMDVAVEVLRLAGTMGLSCPQDIEIVIWGDTFACEVTEPQLSAIRVPFAELGAQATELLLAELAESRLQTRQVSVPSTFVERASSSISPLISEVADWEGMEWPP